MKGKLLIFSAPSGTGKTTIVHWLMNNHPELRMSFSVSCTTRSPRAGEHDGTDYFFISEDQFRTKIAAGAFVEYEEVYAGCLYGTLRSEVDARLLRGENVVFDVDVAGGCNIKRQYGDEAMSVFIQPPSINELRRRLVARGTDSPETIEKRLAKAAKELEYAPRFDCIVVNDVLSEAEETVYSLVHKFLCGA
ncbi:MAG: guanylate kinase [Prevotella sp.]|nr:guanylate kinase [Prevotella sp.]